MNLNATTAHIVAWLKDYASSAGVKGYVVGVSGGIDSALTATLVARTGLPVQILEMPIHQPSDHVSRGREFIAQLQSEHANVASRVVDLTQVFDAYTAALKLDATASTELSLANTRARLRMATLYAEAQNLGMLVAGTGNKIEDFGVGFFTKYGDGGVDVSPIADLTKSDVRQLASCVGVPVSILEAPPTDGLWEDERSDEAQLGASYEELEWAMDVLAAEGWISDQEPSDLLARVTDREREVLNIYMRFHRANRHKMLPIPVCTIPDHLKV